jgi:TM2 domain-containing membrane protein YozV
MKKSIAAPLCSGLVVPGLGQILNQQFRKGLIILGLVFVLFVAGAVKLAFLINSLTRVRDLAEISQTAALSRGDLFLVAGIAAAFLILWVYSVVDAFWVAFQAERSDREKRR